MLFTNNFQFCLAYFNERSTCAKDFLHSLHTWGFSPVCIRRCNFRAVECENDREQIWGEGFPWSPLIFINISIYLTLSSPCKSKASPLCEPSCAPWAGISGWTWVRTSTLLACCTRLDVGMMLRLRWSTQRANDRYKDHLDGQLTNGCPDVKYLPGLNCHFYVSSLS